MPLILKHLWMVSIIDLELMMVAVAVSDSLSHLKNFSFKIISSKKQGGIQGVALYYGYACQTHLIECIPGQLHSLPFPWGTVGCYLIHILPLRRAQNTFTEHSAWIFKRGSFDWHDIGSQEKKNTLSLQRTSAANSFQNTDGTGNSGPLLSFLYPQATGTAPCQLAKYLQAKNISF